MIILRKDGTTAYTLGDTLPAGCIQVDHEGLPVIAGWPTDATLAAAAVAPELASTPKTYFYRAAEMRAAAARREVASEQARLESIAAAAKDKK